MGKFNFIETKLKDVTIVEPTVFGDERGFFMETYSESEFVAGGIAEHFVQENHSRSVRGVLRGMHFQCKHTQGKLIRVARGSVLDVVVDLRAESDTYGQYVGVLLSGENKRQLYVPPRFAHGFLCIEDGTDFLYKCTEYYAPQFDAGVLWNDADIAIDWRLAEFGLSEEDLLLSDKDRKQPTLNALNREKLFY